MNRCAQHDGKKTGEIVILPFGSQLLPPPSPSLADVPSADAPLSPMMARSSPISGGSCGAGREEEDEEVTEAAAAVDVAEAEEGLAWKTYH